MQSKTSRWPTGIEVRHSRECPTHADPSGRCKWSPTYRGWTYSKHDGKKIRRSFPTLAAAKAWRADATSAINRGTLRAPKRTTLREAADELIEGMQSGAVLNRNRRPYKPGVIRQYADSLRLHVLPELGGARLADITRRDLQDHIDRLRARGCSGSSIHNALTPLHVIFRRAIQRGELAVSPTRDLEQPEGAGRRERAATTAEAKELLAALPERIRPIYAAAFYGGLRRGELQALRWEDVDLPGVSIHVRQSWDPKAGFVEPKSAKGKRTVPITGLLRDELLEHRARTGRSEGFVFGSTSSRPFTPTNVRKQALAAWRADNKRRATAGERLLEPITLHECRHTYVSLMHDAGFTLEEVGDYVGHNSADMTDAYRHLLDGHEVEAARRFGDYLYRSDTQARLAVVGQDEG